jgi:hypothetical protein
MQMVKIKNRTRAMVVMPVLLLVSSAACSSVDDAGAKGKTASAGMGSGNEGNTNTEGGSGDGANEPGVGGASPSAGSGGTGGTAPVPDCKPGKMQCKGNQPQLCNDDEEWEDAKPCTGATKVCTGEGICSAYRLVNAGIDSFGMRPAETPGLILKEQTLSVAPRVCGTKEPIICISGGIR